MTAPAPPATPPRADEARRQAQPTTAGRVHGARDPAADTSHRTAWALVAAITIGIAVRGWLALSHDFPLNDGGMFYQMADEVAAAHFHLPWYTDYNYLHIPFAYSPLAFYLAAALHVATRIPLIDLFRYLPFLATALTVVAFASLTRHFLRSRETQVAAVVAFALVPRAFLWLIMGGGLTRSFGLLFAILALEQIYLMYTRRRVGHVVAAAVLSGLTPLTHLGTAPFLAFSALLFFLFYGRHRFGVYSSALVAAGAILVAAPWWVTVIARHGLAPFIAANATGGSIFVPNGTREQIVSSLARWGVGTAEPFIPLIGMLALIGAFTTIPTSLVILPAWWLEIILLDARAGATYSTVPMAMLAGLAVTDVVIPFLRGDRLRWPPGLRVRRTRWVSVAVCVVLFGYCLGSAFVERPALETEGRYLQSLTAPERAAMAWVGRATPSGSRVLVVTAGASGGWYADRTLEWFPVLAQRQSVATVQGREWLPGHDFLHGEERYDDVQACGNWVAACLDAWRAHTGLSFSYVYIPKLPGEPCCRLLLSSLAAAPDWQRVYDGPGATVYARRPS